MIKTVLIFGSIQTDKLNLIVSASEIEVSSALLVKGTNIAFSKMGMIGSTTWIVIMISCECIVS